MSLDLETIEVIRVLIALELSLVLFVVERPLPDQPGLRPWALGTFSTTAGVVLMALAELDPSAPFALAAAAFFYLGVAFVWVGAREFCGLSGAQRPVWAGLAATLLLAMALLPALPPRLAAELSFSSAAVAWSVAIVWTLLRHAPARQKLGTRAAGALFTAFGSFHLVRVFAEFATDDGLLGAWPPAAVALASIFFGVAWVFALISLTSQRLLMQLRAAARRDALTGLVNRRALREDGARLIELCRRQGKPCAVLLVDLDRFKRLNDTHGHAVGDRALRHFAAVAMAGAGPGQLLGRYGGEEFCLVIPGGASDGALQIGERLRELIASSPLQLGERELPITVSVGVAWAQGAELDLGRLIARADEALYRAKSEGRDRVRAAA